ncbi:uncharacterized protein C5orf34 homolog [Saccostrea echinata]|uniref:uncharacterized protein C5orf34 homolog n=1 Tax=Saccostrea echinata TaxID=191078 RepID=UPI002A83D7FD|nr:uncharacterized protein C5orf34 homolog [Saccostrea echinata]
MATPALMVLYSNDAVEVRYSDQSCLQVAPCGSTFVHHESPKEILHPAHGMKSISQRSEFVTSDYKYKLIQALDFRNRFAEKPYICKDLTMPDQIVPLYASIKEAAWPKSVDDCEMDYLPDGSVRLLSTDEYASLVLSPHKQDFTVCYLSQISTEPRKPKRHHHKMQSHKSSSTNNSAKHSNENLDSTLRDNIDKVPLRQEAGLNLSTSLHSVGHIEQGINNGHESPRLDQSVSKQTQNELNISPISMASSMRSPHTSPEGQEEKNKFHRYSTPTNHITDQEKGDEIEIGGKKSAFRHYRHQQDNGTDGSFLEVIESQKKSENSKPLNLQSSIKPQSNSGQQERSASSGKESQSESKSFHKHAAQSSGKLQEFSFKTPPLSPSKESTHSSFSSQSEQDSLDETSARCLYTWVTRHFSCEECPVAWRHPLNMARSIIEKREDYEKKMLEEGVKRQKAPVNQQYCKDKFCMCPFPTPTPLTCPAQHLHRLQTNYIYDDDKNSLDNLTTFKQGRLKVLMVEGVIFRILRLSSTKVLEIFPGDGSVIVSQGVKGHYYKHSIPYGDRGEVEERSYSIKSLPPHTPSAAYSVEKLIKRASRFLNQADQEDKVLTKADVCCWKQQSLVIEPLPTSVLEECTVPGYGRFTAFSSGHVRIVFNDRTSLDMWCDFSKRVECCIQHSDGIHNTQMCQNGEGSMPTALKVNPEFHEGFCKLLLPNGQYQVVDVKKPGLYRKYTDAAIEWGSWVNSLPSQRKEFYSRWQQQQSEELMVQKELQKIKCFNYITDHTATHGKGGVANDDFIDGFHQIKGQGHQSASYLPTESCPVKHTKPRTRYNVHFSPPSASNYPIRTQENSHMSTKSHDNNQSVLLPSSLEMMRGFDSVREALLRTSKAIHDIDDILEKRKK